MTVSITKKFKLVSFAAVMIMTVLSKLFSITGSILSSDVMITGSSSAFVRLLPQILSYGAVFCNAAAVSCAAGGVMYALVYFGKRTALRSSLLFILCAFLGAAANLYYAVLSNSMNIVTTVALVLTLLVDIAYLALSLAIAFGAAFFSLKRCNRTGRHYSPVIAAVAVAAAALLIHLADLTFMSVIPFINAKADAGRALLNSDIYAIIEDYIYYFAVYGALPVVLTLISIRMYKAATGELMPKTDTKN